MKLPENKLIMMGRYTLCLVSALFTAIGFGAGLALAADCRAAVLAGVAAAAAALWSGLR